MSRIGFIGLGNMGMPMAANLRKAGHEIIGFDVAADKAEIFARHRGSLAASAREAAAGAEFVITMLPAGKQVRQVYAGADGLIGACAASNTLLIDGSTIDVATAREIAEMAEKAGLAMLDAPVSGGVGGATAGTLTFMVGGTAAAFARARPILATMGRNIVHAGESGAGQAAKICNNMILGISMLAVSEAFVLADRLGLDRARLFEVSANSSGQCWALTNYCPVPGPVPSSPANRDYAAGFAAALMLKDLDLAQTAAAAANAATPLGAQAARFYRMINDSGLATKDFSIAFEWLAA